MTDEELKELKNKSTDELFKYLLDNPNHKDELLKYLKNADKDKWFSLSALTKDMKSNPRSDGASRAREIRENEKEGFQEINISLLVDNPYQPRIEMNQDSIRELANSIQDDGLQSPIKISPNKNDTFTIVFGHRRVAAHKLLGLSMIKCIIEEVDNTKLRRLALVENIQREDLSLIEKALAFKDAMKQEGFETNRELANQLGINEARISEILKLLKLHKDIRDDLAVNKKIKDVTALALINSIDEDKQVEIYEKLKNGDIDREGIRNYINNRKKDKEQIEKEQHQTKIRSNRLNFTYKSSLTDKKDLKEFNTEVKRLTDELFLKLKEKEKELLSK